jgi:hypothetical protein
MPSVVSMLVPGSASEAVLLRKSTSMRGMGIGVCEEDDEMVGVKKRNAPMMTQFSSMTNTENLEVVCGEPGSF